MSNKTTHKENLNALKRIEGHVRAVQKMVEDGRYCIDIIIQIQAVIGGLYSVHEKILSKHIEGCVIKAFGGTSEEEKDIKTKEILKVVHNLHKLR